MNPFEKAIDNILGSVGLTRSSKAAIPSVSSSGSADPFAIWRPSSGKVAADKALDVFTGWTYACIRAIAEEISAIEFELYKVKKGGDYERVYDHEMLDLLAGASSTSTGIEILYTIATHLEAVGNAYIYLEGVKNDTDAPDFIHIMNPARMKVVLSGDFPKRISHYLYREGTKEHTFQPFEILHIKYPDPQNSFEGIGTVQAVAQWIDADNYAMEFNRRFFLNGARIGGFLESDANRTPEQLEYIKKSFENIYKGVENAHKVLALPKGTVYKEGGQTQKDLDFANMMDMMRDRILAGFRVPRTALGITDDVNRANAEATNYVFALRTIKPKMQLIVAYLNEFLVPRYGDDIILDFKDPVPENREQKIQEMTAATGNAPVMSINEAREHYFGLEPVEGGDEVSKPFNFLTMGALKPKAENRPASKMTGKRLKKAKTPQAKRAEARKTMSEEIAAAAAKALEDTLKTIGEAKKKGLQNVSDEEFEALYKGFVVRVTPYESNMREKIRTFNRDQKAEVLKNLDKAIKRARGGKLKAVDADALFDTDEWISILFRLTGPILTDLFGKEGKEAAALLGFTDLDPLTPEVREALDRGIELMSKKYNETTLDLLKAKLEEGIEEGLGIDELKGRVADVYEFSDEIRAARVARTETFRTANAATKEAWDQTGVVESIKWYTAADERVCPWCDPMHGEVVDIKENFFDKGDEHRGSDGQVMALDYDDVGAPPLHVDCRCYIRPEVISV